MITYYKVGDLAFSMEGEGRYYDACADYFSDALRKEVKAEDCMLKLHILNEKDKLKINEKFYAVSTSIAFNRDTYRVNNGTHYAYAVKNLFRADVPTEAWIKPKGSSKSEKLCSVPPFRFAFKHHDKYSIFAKRIANYSCLWYIFAITLMKIDAVFIHSGMVGKDDGGIILTGTGGCGKTSTMAELISNHGWNYVAEDFGILTGDGHLRLMQKKASVHGSDIKYGDPYLNGAVKRLGPVKKFEWKAKKLARKNPVYRFKPSEIFGDHIKDGAPLTTVAFLSRVRGISQPEMRVISMEDLADRIRFASFRELKELYELLTNIRAVSGDNYADSYPAVSELEERYKEILIRGLSKANRIHLNLPLGVDPKDTAAIILKVNKEGVQ